MVFKKPPPPPGHTANNALPPPPPPPKATCQPPPPPPHTTVPPCQVLTDSGGGGSRIRTGCSRPPWDRQCTCVSQGGIDRSWVLECDRTAAAVLAVAMGIDRIFV